MPALPRRRGRGRPRPPDLRAVVLGVSAWAGGLAVLGLPGVDRGGRSSCWRAVARRRPAGGGGRAVGRCWPACWRPRAVGGVTTLRVEADRHEPGGACWPAQGAAVTVTGAGDRRTRCCARAGSGRSCSPGCRVSEVVGRGRRYETGVPVLVIGDESWRRVELGSRVTGDRPARPSRRRRTWPGCCRRGPPAAGAAPTRGAVRRRRAGPGRDPRSVAGAAPDARALVPALVVGDDRSMSDRRSSRTSGPAG